MLSKRNGAKIPGNCATKDIVQLFSSVIFLGLALYLFFFLDLPEGTPREDITMLATLLGAYGLWKLWKGVAGCRPK